MRLAVYNVENLFNRAKVMNLDTWADGKDVLKKFADLNRLLGQVTYSAANKARMVALLKALGLEKSDQSKFVVLRRHRGQLVKRPRTGGMQIVADGRADWVGSLDLQEEPVDELAMRITAQVMYDLNADILGVVEAESRPALRSFMSDVVAALGNRRYRQVMLIDGNDSRGIDVGLVTRDGFSIGALHSHVDDRSTDGQAIFSRDCAEYTVTAPNGAEITVMMNHFKSKGYGSPQANDARRKTQAKRVRQICQARLDEGCEYIAVMGDFNDAPTNDPLKPLLVGSNFKDVFVHPQFDNGGFPGTFGSCGAANKFDYILLSPKLYSKVKQGGVWRKGMWPGVRPVRWPAYPEMKKAHQAGSDHAALWVDIDV